MAGVRYTEEEYAEVVAKQQGEAEAHRPLGKATPEPGQGLFMWSKANMRRTTVDDHKFPTGSEAKRYGDLRMMELAGEIKDLKVHPSWNIEISGQPICRVVADFMYWRKVSPLRSIPRRMPTYHRIVEDVKKRRVGKDGKVKFSTDTQISKIKRKLLAATHGITIEIVWS